MISERRQARFMEVAVKRKSAFGSVLALGILAIGINPAFAHAHVKSMNIAENAQLQQSPSNFIVKFSEKAGLVKVVLTRSTGEVVPIDYQPPKGMSAAFQIPLPALSNGAYTLSWRTMGDDGHAMNGAVHFTVATK